MVPFSRIDKDRLQRAIAAVAPHGTTPIAYTLRQVGQDFEAVAGKKVIVLLTDGIEECGGSPINSIRDAHDENRIRPLPGMAINAV